MGVPTSEVGYTSATAGKVDHEVHKGHVVALAKVPLTEIMCKCCRSQLPRILRRRSAIARLLGLWVRIPLQVWMCVCYERCVLSGRGLCDDPITHPEKSYRLWCVIVCDLETSWMRQPKTAFGRSATRGKIFKCSQQAFCLQTSTCKLSRSILSNTTLRIWTRTHYIGDMFRLTL
jgi:hypothetical protein